MLFCSSKHGHFKTIKHLHIAIVLKKKGFGERLQALNHIEWNR